MAISLSGSSDGNNIAGTSSQTVSSENKKAAAGEMVGGCSVCSDDQGTEENPLVYCDGCEVAVHQACYGIVDVPPGNWFCRKCEFGDSQTKIRCELCPSKDGALKKTEAGLWAHVVCALYIPEVRFGNNNTMEPIEIKHIQADRYNKSCYLCEEKGNTSTASYGAVMDCHKQNCKQSFHVTCAQSAGLLCEEAGQGSDNVIYCGYCKHHFRKLKATGNRKSANSLNNNSSSSYLDSASDSSQDNDSQCNTTENDKNSTRTNKLSNLPTNLSMNDALAPNSHSTATTTTSSSTVPSLITNNSSISLTIPLNSSNSNQQNKTSNINTTTTTTTTTTTSSSLSSSGTPQKKKRAPKNVQVQSNSSSSATNNNMSTLLATATMANPLSSTAPFPASNVSNQLEINASQDIYKWIGGNKEQQETTSASNNNNNNISKVSSKKKQQPSSSGTQASSSAKPSATLNAQPSSMTSYNLNKIGSPNLSLSTSPSLTSPSNSTKSTSNSSTSSISTTTATASSSSSSSSSSTSSNSPSPALLSPNVANRGLGTVRLESPLASNSKAGISMHNRLSVTESIPNNVALPQNSLQTRINLDNPKNNFKKNPLASSSLLSTAVPMLNEPTVNTNLPVASSSSTVTKSGGRDSSDTIAPSRTSFANLGLSNPMNGSAKDSSTTSPPGQGNSAINVNTQPTVPPLIIPVPQSTTTTTSASNNNNSATTKPRAAKATASKITRKKSTETGGESKPEPPKPKTSRAKKVPATGNNNETSAPKPETPKRAAKSKVGAKTSDTSAVALNEASSTTTTNKTQAITSSPTKRKSRSSSNESSGATTNTTAAAVASPSPNKRVRKKKADQPITTTANDQSTTANSMPPLNITANSSQLLSTASNAPVGTSPLMINPPLVTNRLLQGLGSLEGGQDVGNRYFSPMISPYATIDPLSATSLSRSSLSRLFTSSSVDNNQASSCDDPAKAFEELRDNTWSHLSKCVLEQAQQFDIPSLIGTLYTLRSENDKLVNKVRDLTMKRDQLVAINARLDLPGPMLTQHLNNTSPNFSAIVSSLTNSPKSLSTSSPSSAMGKQPLSVGPYNHIPPPGSLGPPNFLDRSSPLVGQPPHSSIKSSSISTPSPPIGAMMAHSTNNRAGLITVNPPYMSSVYPPINPMAQLGNNQQGSSYYSRQ